MALDKVTSINTIKADANKPYLNIKALRTIIAEMKS